MNYSVMFLCVKISVSICMWPSAPPEHTKTHTRSPAFLTLSRTVISVLFGREILRVAN